MSARSHGNELPQRHQAFPRQPAGYANLTALRATRAMGDRANNPGGTGAAGAGMEMAMGVMMANQMGGASPPAPSPTSNNKPPSPPRCDARRSHRIQSGDRQSTVRTLRRKPPESHGR